MCLTCDAAPFRGPSGEVGACVGHWIVLLVSIGSQDVSCFDWRWGGVRWLGRQKARYCLTIRGRRCGSRTACCVVLLIIDSWQQERDVPLCRRLRHSLAIPDGAQVTSLATWNTNPANSAGKEIAARGSARLSAVACRCVKFRRGFRLSTVHSADTAVRRGAETGSAGADQISVRW